MLSNGDDGKQVMPAHSDISKQRGGNTNLVNRINCSCRVNRVPQKSSRFVLFPIKKSDTKEGEEEEKE